MAQKMIVFTIVQAIIFQMAYSQVIGRYGGCGCSALGVGELPYLPAGYLPPLPASYLPPAPTTVIQDSSVANNLANALQLLVVSNLLSSTLPLEPPVELIAPSFGAPFVAGGPVVASSFGAPLVAGAPFTPCGCGGCGCNNCALSPYSVFF